MAHDLTRDDFDAIIADFKRRLGIPLKRHFSGDQDAGGGSGVQADDSGVGIEVIESPFEQLRLAIRRVLASWESPKAKAYPPHHGHFRRLGHRHRHSGHGLRNLSREAGTGVIFTHNPRWAGDVLKLWGISLRPIRGGRGVRTGPYYADLAVPARNRDARDRCHLGDAFSRDLSRAEALGPHADRRPWLEPPGVEFTFESPAAADLFMLQTRDMAIRESPKVLKLISTCRRRSCCWGTASA